MNAKRLAGSDKHCNFASMTTKWILAALTALTGGTGIPAAAQYIDTLFANVPDSLCPILTRSNRLDLLDLFNSHMRAVTPNLYGGQTTLEAKSERALRIRQTARTEWSMRLFGEGEQMRIMVCQTYLSPRAESLINWYDTAWTSVTPPPGFNRPQPADFAPHNDSLRTAIAAWPAHYISVTSTTGADSVRFELAPASTSSELDKQARQLLLPVVLRWDATQARFVNCSTQNQATPPARKAKNTKK